MAKQAPRVLITVSGRIPERLREEIAAGARPRADYEEIAAALRDDGLDADVVDVGAALSRRPRLGTAMLRLGGPGLLLAWHCFRERKRCAAVLTDGEQVGLPFTLLCRLFGRGTTRHVMIVHVISTRAKDVMSQVGRLASLIDRFVVYSRHQANVLRERWAVDDGRIVMSCFMVDTTFFRPRERTPGRARIVAAGLERRDYRTLIEAVRDLDADVLIAAASPWSTQADSSRGVALPSNVTVRSLSLAELRDAYVDAAVVVVPLFDVDFQAGVTTILEGMSMARPVVTTATTGRTETIVDGVSGWHVPPGDPDALRAMLERVIRDPDAGRRGAAAREWAVENADIQVYARQISTAVRASLS